MSDTVVSQQFPPKEHKWVAWGITLVTSALFTCGSMYLAGYWHYFRINFLDYISVNEIIARSVFDVVPVILVLVEVAVVGFIVSKDKRYSAWLSRKEQEAKAKLKPGDWRLNPLVRTFALPIFSVLMIIFNIVFWMIVDDDNYVSAAVGCLPFILSIIGAFVADVFYKKISSETGWLLALVIGLIPTTCYIRGVVYAEQRVNGTARYDCEYVVYTVPEVEEHRAILTPEYVYAGRMGGFAFLASKTKQITLVIPESRVLLVDVYRKKAPQESH